MIVQQSAHDTDGTQEWRAERLLRRAVVDARRAEVLGTVADVVFYPPRQELAGLLIGPAGAAGSLLEAVRSTFGGSPLGLRLVEAQQIVALKRDVVVVDGSLDRHVSARSHAHLPRLTDMRGLTVVTVKGQRIGRFADVLLTGEGRTIAGYLVAVEAAPRDASPLPASHEPQAQSQDQSQEQARQDASRPPAAGALITIPASTPIRLGRDVIILGSLGNPQYALAEPSTSALAARSETRDEIPGVDAPNEYPPRWPAPESDGVAMPDNKSGDKPSAEEWPPHDEDGASPDAPTQA